MNPMNINLNLAKLGGVVIEQNGKRYVALSVDDNEIFVSDKGGLYLNLQATPLREEMYGQSHVLKRSLSKEAYKALSKQERDRMPIVGGVKQIVYNNSYGNNGGYQSNAPQQAPNNNGGGIGDLPF